MIRGIGIDIIEIERVKRAVEKRSGFVGRFFASEEVAYYRKRGMNVSSIAGGFAAKEAVVKAMGTGFGAFGWRDVAVLRDNRGKPEVRLGGRARELCDSLDIEEILVSISHSRDYAAAQAIAIGGDGYEGCNAQTDEGD
jgi:holo-[acyl-carrier-protein] synthase